MNPAGETGYSHIVRRRRSKHPANSQVQGPRGDVTLERRRDHIGIEKLFDAESALHRRGEASLKI